MRATAREHGVVQSATDAWWAWRLTDPVAPEGAVQIAFVAGYLTAVTGAALGPACLALGLGRSRRPRPVPALAALVPLAVGAVAAVAGVGLLVRELAAASDLSQGGPALVALGLVHRLLTTLGALGLVALALAAVRGRPAAVLLIAGFGVAALGAPRARA